MNVCKRALAEGHVIGLLFSESWDFVNFQTEKVKQLNWLINAKYHAKSKLIENLKWLISLQDQLQKNDKLKGQTAGGSEEGTFQFF